MREKAIIKCEETGQKQLLRFVQQLNSKEEQELYQQILETDFSVITNSVKGSQERGMISPIEAMKLDEIKEQKITCTNCGTKLTADIDLKKIKIPRNKNGVQETCSFMG